MIRERWTVLFLREEAKAVRQYSLPLRAVRPVMASVGILAVMLLSAAAFLLYDSGARARASLLARENQLLEEELREVRAKVGHVEAQVADLAEKDRQARLLAGRVGLDPDVLEVGVGGPGLDRPGEGELWSLDPEASEMAYGIRYDLDVLERKTDLLHKSSDETFEIMDDQRDRLEAMPSVWPVGGHLSSRFSYSRLHPIHKEYMPHWGIDVSAVYGTPIIASGPGIVTFAGTMQGYGFMVEIDHGFGLKSRYAHASKLLVYKGKRVERREVIAQVGNSGLSRAPHLHFEILENGVAVNPMKYMLSSAPPRVRR